jgi:hypothetical protein
LSVSDKNKRRSHRKVYDTPDKTVATEEALSLQPFRASELNIGLFFIRTIEGAVNLFDFIIAVFMDRVQQLLEAKDAYFAKCSVRLLWQQ